jgi:hypothetical protein
MYVSHPVRRIRENPAEGESVTLALEASDDDAADAAAAAIRDLGGTVDAELRFHSLKVTVLQEQVDAVCALDGLESVETANTLTVEGDAGEDVDLDDA